MLTLEERERRAYANGQIEAADLLAMAIEADAEVRSDCAYFEEQALDAQREIDTLQDKIEQLEEELASLRP